MAKTKAASNLQLQYPSDDRGCFNRSMQTMSYLPCSQIPEALRDNYVDSIYTFNTVSFNQSINQSSLLLRSRNLQDPSLVPRLLLGSAFRNVATMSEVHGLTLKRRAPETLLKLEAVNKHG